MLLQHAQGIRHQSMPMHGARETRADSPMGMSQVSFTLIVCHKIEIEEVRDGSLTGEEL